MKRIPRWQHTVAAALVFCALRTTLPAQVPTTRELTTDHRWLNFPLSDTAPLRTVEVTCEGQPMHVFSAQLAPGHPGWWTSLDLGTQKGSKVKVHIADAAGDPTLLSCLDETDESKELGPELYHEALRPLFHFSARRGWLNDPNGLVYCDGQYHLFFQHNPFSWANASKHWGHAVSTDLVRWHEVAEALSPDANGQMYSGSAVVDRANTSGLVAGAKTPLVLVYTNAGHGSSQCLASSQDGSAFDKFPGNPVIPKMAGPSRDPRAFWYEPTHSWVLGLYVGTPDPLHPDTPHEFHDAHAVHLYTSRNLREWQETDVVNGGAGAKDRFLYECPDLFPLPVDGQADQTKWVIQGGSSEYELGSFDGKKFTAESGRLLNRQGGDFYAGQTFGNAPGGRIVQIGWMRAPTPGMPFNQCMSVPLDLSLRTTPQGVRLTYAPVEELKKLRGPATAVPAGTLNPPDNAFAQIKGEGLDVEAELKPGTAKEIVFTFRGVDVRYDVTAGIIHCTRFSAPLPLDHGILRLRLLVDRTTIEIFGGNGAVYLPAAILPAAADQSHRLTAVGGSAEIVSLNVYPMRNSWLP